MKKNNLSTLLSSNTLSDDDWGAIQKIREKRDSLGIRSLTSEQYQNDILDACFRSLSINGGPIIELGIFQGALSCQLAYLARKYNRPLILVDISPEFCEMTKTHLLQLELAEDNNDRKTIFITGTVKDLFMQFDFHNKPPCFIVVDADHTYRGARIDLCTILSNVPNIPVIGFHDYGVKNDERLQMEHPDGSKMIVYGIYKAILDVIGDDNALHPIGKIGGKNKEYGNDGFNYIDEGEPEGALLFPALLDRTSFIMAYSFMASESDRRVAFDVIPAALHDDLIYALKNSRWIKLGRKLGFCKALDTSNL